jgi:phospholipid/cholesterol/gamma-HCH transport system permease protein
MTPHRVATEPRGDVTFDRLEGGVLLVRFTGVWLLHSARPSLADAARALGEGQVRRVTFATTDLAAWDSSLVTYLDHLLELCAARSIDVDRSGLPAGVTRLLALAAAVPEKKGARGSSATGPWLERVGEATVATMAGLAEFLDFLGQATVTFGRFVLLRARFRRSDLMLVIQECGAQALPIVTLISFLVGLILAFVGAVQLERFGASIYVANLVGVGMAREMGAMMSAIIMAGRTGAAFAAQLGTMKVTEEIDALTTMGIRPMEFLVLPRMLALCLMMPLLCLYADLVGIVGGAVVGTGMLHLTPTLYVQQTLGAITFTDFATGVFKSGVFGVLIAISGCLRGMQCGSSASAVGDAATSAVVTSIVFIVVTDGAFAVIFNVLGI